MRWNCLYSLRSNSTGLIGSCLVRSQRNGWSPALVRSQLAKAFTPPAPATDVRENQTIAWVWRKGLQVRVRDCVSDANLGPNSTVPVKMIRLPVFELN